MAEVQRNFISFPPSNGNGSRDNRRRVIDSLDEVRGYRLEVQQSPVIILSEEPYLISFGSPHSAACLIK